VGVVVSIVGASGRRGRTKLALVDSSETFLEELTIPIAKALRVVA